MKNIKYKLLAKTDLSLLFKWYNQAHLKESFGEGRGWSYEEIEKKYLPRILGEEEVFCYIAYIDKTAIGFIQYYSIGKFPRSFDLKELSWYKNAAAIDVFMGDIDWLNKGYGSSLIKEFIEKIVFIKYDSVVVDPDANNTQAIRAYEKAGFKVIKGLTDNKGDKILLMVMQKSI
jgi:aminoglycoside 6'-N-acetyltransferase